MKRKGLRPRNIYLPLKINRVNFYKAIKTSNIKNKSLLKIVDFLGYEINTSLRKKYAHKKRKDKKNILH